ncbi:o-succinylbenzoate--CoA ligase [Alkalibacillus salilacus]|uniref:2-succinylbenzoate--CoA ligase n=1 Tax=Alkalibacillus salilacus TaxID=284582 RepID=A0ABT9VIQ3_9BACI|nr:o-succinylbenzoate--CoA ligase [Alkalibacillus salilacus]MDQ0160853.1 O-succinylbenzoic acid--CoA ligase [Alkalibacillus salilacus]
MTTMINWLEKRADLSPNTDAVKLSDGTTYSFSELYHHARSMALQLKQEGIKSGDHVSVISPNHYRFLVTIHALNLIGAVSFLMNIRLSSAEIAFQLQDGDVSAVILDQRYENLVGDDLNVIDIHSGNLDQPLEQKSHSMDLDDLSHVIYTSGTTGQPKGVELTYGNHWWNANGSALNLGLYAHDRWLLSLPMFHVGGLSIVYRSVIYGIPLHLHESFDVEAIHDDIMNQGVTIMSVVSVMLDQLLERLGNDYYPEQFRCMLLGGGPAPKPLLTRARDKHVPVYQTYGMTETASQFCTLDDQNAFDKLGAAGKPLFPNQLDIVQDDESLPAQQVGEIVVHGPSVTKGYYKRPDETADKLQNGWLKTGDLGYFDKDGFLYVVDRRKDLIISGGENVYPAEIESVLKGHPHIADAGVVGQKNERWGEVPVAFIVEREPVDEQELTTYCQNHLANYKVPKTWYKTDELPRNAAKKLLRHQLQARLEE